MLLLFAKAKAAFKFARAPKGGGFPARANMGNTTRVQLATNPRRLSPNTQRPCR